MGIEHGGSDESRSPEAIEIVEARVDFQLTLIYEAFEEELVEVADETARGPIRDLVMRCMRASYAKGATDLAGDPDIVKKIYHGIDPSGT